MDDMLYLKPLMEFFRERVLESSDLQGLQLATEVLAAMQQYQRVEGADELTLARLNWIATEGSADPQNIKFQQR